MIPIILFILLNCLSSLAQFSEIKYNSVNVKLHKGFVLKHNAEVGHLATEHPTIVELDMGRQTNGSKEWHQIHNYPTTGLSINYVFIDKTKPIGDMASFLFYMSKSIASTPRSRIDVRMGFGPGYVEKKFDLYSNYKNVMFGSHLNFCMNGRIEYFFKAGKHFNFNAGVGIIHFSNGGIKLPDQGINIPTFNVGMGYQHAAFKKFFSDSLSLFRRKILFTFLYAGGLKEEYPTGGPKFWASTFSSYVTWKTNRKSGLTAGIDIFYDPSLKRYYKVESLPVNKKTKVGIVAGHELFFGKLSLLTQLGFYIFDKNRIYLPVYERIGFKYYLNKALFLHLNMKLHLGAIDYVESGIGVLL